MKYEREGYAFKVDVVYERLLMFCSHCLIIGHNVSKCQWLHPTTEEQVVGTKHDVVEAQKIIKRQGVERIREEHISTSVAGATIAETEKGN